MLYSFPNRVVFIHHVLQNCATSFRRESRVKGRDLPFPPCCAAEQKVASQVCRCGVMLRMQVLRLDFAPYICTTGPQTPLFPISR